jgi:hypothetical protein
MIREMFRHETYQISIVVTRTRVLGGSKLLGVRRFNEVAHVPNGYRDGCAQGSLAIMLHLRRNPSVTLAFLVA